MTFATIAFTGPPDAACPITLSFVHELLHPVAFASNPLQPYELEPLWKWMLASDHRHPLTSEPCSLSDIVALKCTDEDKCTVAMLEGMWLTLQNTKVFFSS